MKQFNKFIIIAIWLLSWVNCFLYNDTNIIEHKSALSLIEYLAKNTTTELNHCDIKVVLIYSESCPHCVKFALIYQEFENKLEYNKIPFQLHAYECSQASLLTIDSESFDRNFKDILNNEAYKNNSIAGNALCESLNVHKYPTLYISMNNLDACYINLLDDRDIDVIKIDTNKFFTNRVEYTINKFAAYDANDMVQLFVQLGIIRSKSLHAVNEEFIKYMNGDYNSLENITSTINVDYNPEIVYYDAIKGFKAFFNEYMDDENVKEIDSFDEDVLTLYYLGTKYLLSKSEYKLETELLKKFVKKNVKYDNIKAYINNIENRKIDDPSGISCKLLSCNLWKFFHYITVKLYSNVSQELIEIKTNELEEIINKSNEKLYTDYILSASSVRDFIIRIVKKYFNCSLCLEHFNAIVTEDFGGYKEVDKNSNFTYNISFEMSEIEKPYLALMFWLWRVHNIVNVIVNTEFTRTEILGSKDVGKNSNNTNILFNYDPRFEQSSIMNHSIVINSTLLKLDASANWEKFKSYDVVEDFDMNKIYTALTDMYNIDLY